ncbi:MAG: ATP-binding protein [Candidatus Odinarchaeota archaeon]
MHEYKIACMGAASVGKTTLIRSIVSPKAKVEIYQPSLAVEMTNIEFPEIAMKFQTWDYPGQSYFIEYHANHYIGTTGAILVFDLTRRETLYKLGEYVKPLLKMAGNIPVVLVGNKSDLRETAMVKLMVSQKEAEQFARELSNQTKHAVSYIEVSATLRKNIRSIFIELGVLLGSPSMRALADAVKTLEKRVDVEVALIHSRDYLAELVTEKALDLLQEKKKVETVIEMVSEGILVLDARGTGYLANKTIKECYWRIYHEEMPVQYNWLEMPSDNLFIRAVKELLIARKNISLTIEPETGLHLQFSSAIIDTFEDLPFDTIIEMRDITPFIEFDNMRKRVISTISHELRTPISAIVQSTTNLKKYGHKMTGEMKDDLLDAISQNAVVLKEQVEELMDIMRIDEGKITLRWEEFSPFKILQDVLNQIEPRRKAKELTITVNVERDLYLYGDPQKIGQVFRIFIDNAVKYSDKRTKIKITSVDNYTGPCNPRKIAGMVIQFKDEGYGILEKDISHLFERFYRAKAVENIPGTGLGLSIADELVKLHGGDIFVDSEINRGSTFSVFLPKMREPPDCTDINRL